MSPESARAHRRREVADLRAAEPDLSLRQMAERLEISRDTVTRDLEVLGLPVPGRSPADRPVADSAPQASPGDPAEPAPPAGAGLVRLRPVDRDLAVLAQTGRTPDEIAQQVIGAVADRYRHALAAGDIGPGVPFVVTGMVLRPLPHRASRTTPAPATGGA
ncbi:helix-turn-helix domain-containing protein [Streptomyces sp. NPDC004610]|uniref:helix-turn-helix domain-containing protein n=1 Tax=unclassified Streptomyces TaxID=2593676 RepID=UPI0033AFED22